MNLGKQLNKLGVFAFTHPWRVVGVWVVILVILGLAAFKFMTPPSSQIAIPGTQAQQAIDRLTEIFPSSGGAGGRIVFNAKDGQINDYKSRIESLVGKVGSVDGVSHAVSPFIDPAFVSKDNKIAYSQVQLDEQIGSVSEKTLNAVQADVAAAREGGLQIEIGGQLISQEPGEILGVGEIAGVAIALMVLVITLGSLIAGGMPIVSALTAIGVSMAGLFAFSRFIDINSTTPVLAVMLGLAVGIDYSLFIVNKYRNLILGGLPLKDAAARALGTAGNAVVFAAITVIIALASLSVVNIPFMTAMGLVGAVSIGISALVALTVTPALLSFAGDRIVTKRQRRKFAELNKKTKKGEDPSTNTFWYKWGRVITARPILTSIAVVVIVGTIALPARDLTLGLPSDQYAAPDTTERKAYDLLAEGFGVGFSAPLTIVVENLPKVSEADKNAIRVPAMEEYEKQVAAATTKQQAAFQQQLQNATSPQKQLELQQSALSAQKAGEIQKQQAVAEIESNVDQFAKFVQLGKIAEQIKVTKNVEKVQPAAVTDNGTEGIIQVIPKTAPASKQTAALISGLRSEDKAREITQGSGATLAVTGEVALQDDINKKLASALPVYLLVIVGLSLILLIIAFRSILVPVKATLGFLLSVLAMFGAVVAVFQWGWLGIADEIGPIVSFVPIIATGILFGLAMDYEFFLVSGMYESYRQTGDAKRSVIEGFGAGSKVVTAAAVIMISVFAGFITNHEAVIQSVGFGLAIGILVDAFLVRMTLVPALMTLFGKYAWWLPKWLDKRLPHVSIEGEVEK